MRDTIIKRYILLVGVLTLMLKGFGQTRSYSMQPHVIVYKTKRNNYDKVPVVYKDHKISAYPDPADIRAMGSRAKPVKLHKGYLLDRYGIGPESRFLNMTFQEYGALKQVPDRSLLTHRIEKSDPFIELYDCGIMPRNPDTVVNRLNYLIDQGILKQKSTALKATKN